MTKKKHPIVFGSGLIALDIVLSGDTATPPRDWAGGTCGNVLAILAFLGWQAYPVARLNGDPASLRVKADLKKWGVSLDYAECAPTSHTPIIVQQIFRDGKGAAKHKFIWSCPSCGARLPSFRPVTANAVERVLPALSDASVFFFDRVSRAILTMAKKAAEEGAIIMFEPSGKGDPSLFKEAVQLAHILKYSRDRFTAIDGAIARGTNLTIEIQTLGREGLRVRDKLNGRTSPWREKGAVHAPLVIDTCGAGDWCTAGLIATLGEGGGAGLKKGGKALLEKAIDYGQLLAAWNCGFEGARGGMYSAKTKITLDAQVKHMKSGKSMRPKQAVPRKYQAELLACPSCPS